MQSEAELFSKLLRELEAEVGTGDVNVLVLNALIDSIGALKVDSASCFCKEFDRLREVVANIEPKFGILSYNFSCLAMKFSVCGKDFSEKKWKHIAIKEVNDILKTACSHKDEILKWSEQLDVEGKSILIHDHSHTVQDVLSHLNKIGRHFKVVIAEQDIEKTHDNIDRLHSLGVPFFVVPSYMMSHVHDKVDMLFFGALTLKDTMDFVMDPGTHGVISEFHVAGIPSYMFIDTAKFSLWKSKKRGEVFVHKHSRRHYMSQREYDRIKFSHDRVPHNLFKRIITNEGVFTPAEIKSLFEERFEKYLDVST